uniref:Uncharacterized protein n=1 Tax=Rhipicephalus zambeziensis TaxID=60191 RepID=A0A224YHW6_9ACAR
MRALIIFKVGAPLLHKRIIETRVIFGALGRNAEESLSGMADVHALPFSINSIQGRRRIWFRSGVQPPPSSPSHSHCSDFRRAVAIGRQRGGDSATPRCQTSTSSSGRSNKSAPHGVLSQRPSRSLLVEPSWPEVHAVPGISHCNTNSTVPCTACRGSSSSSSRRPSSFRERPRWWLAAAAAGSRALAAAEAGSSRPAVASGNPAEVAGSRGSAGGSSSPGRSRRLTH